MPGVLLPGTRGGAGHPGGACDVYRLDGPDGHNRFPARFDKRDVEQLNTLRLFAGEELLPD